MGTLALDCCGDHDLYLWADCCFMIQICIIDASLYLDICIATSIST